nr:cytochrome b [Dictyocaulus viviparus]AFV32112.2 cytochrome b [Dictyocaulus viviparus]
MSSLLYLPSSKSLSIFWNFGSMLGMILFLQIFTGVFLTFFYVPEGLVAFDSVQYIMYEVGYGWVFRIFHFNGASLFFIFLYLHIFKGLFMCSYRLKKVWMTGLLMFFLIMMEAFMGYVLVWAQMSFWAAVVITSLLSVIPYYGSYLVVWIWGGFSVCSATLKFFFVLHFLLPWLVLLIIFLHLFFLHETGSTSVLYTHGDYDKVMFGFVYWLKDLYNFIYFFMFFLFVFLFPYLLGDPEMFVEANSMVSPVHIVPEWYFLFAYAILRAIPNKVLGVLALFMSVFSFFFFSLLSNYVSLLFKLNKMLVFLFLICSVFLSWLGQCMVEYPFYNLSEFFSFFYFFLVFLLLLNYWFVKYLFF